MLADQFKDKKIILASKSPRRKELLQELGFQFDVIVSNTDEHINLNLSFGEIAEQLARQKVLSVAHLAPEDAIIIGGDTIVCVNDKILGKPKNHQEAFEMLKMLSDNTHKVISSVCIKYQDKILVNHDIAKVHFKTLTDEEINFYIKQYSPFDKAGAYGIQEWIGLRAINKIEGSFYTIMGFPTHLVYQMMEDILY
ncbi:MAG: septum formation protein Maf [Bacteroidales bacterium]|jgi:septum formation protein|nr:septum formation protein Maf [Bacteroidales bacterium]MBR4452910.1 septum formation protein Maf [Bacteroidales bacterium]